MAKKPKILSMKEYGAGLLGASFGSKAWHLLGSRKKISGGGLISAGEGSRAFKKAIKRRSR
tara:strand:- start:763 stop:945 length:183 start_codon:yes stop_codon:yes gene_type:complete